MPKVSICIPAYEQVEYLKKCLDSILIQNYADYEVIVTDDSRSDQVEKLIREYDFGGRLKYYRNNIRLGSPENWNEAIRRASGQYIKIIHHDDWFASENSLVGFVNLLENNPKSDFGFSASYVIIEGENERVHSVTNEQLDDIKSNPSSLFTGNIIGAPTAIIFKNSGNIFFDNKLKWLVDLDFYIRFFQRNNSFVYTYQPLVITFAAKGRVTDYCDGNKEVEIFEYFYVFQNILHQNSYRSIKNIKTNLLFLISICKRHSIKSTKDVRQIGYKGEIHSIIKFYFFFSKRFFIMEKIFMKFLKLI
jgi:glycosyltransferase involved in cell wall biosynthesis